VTVVVARDGSTISGRLLIEMKSPPVGDELQGIAVFVPTGNGADIGSFPSPALRCSVVRLTSPIVT
jgi:hypothetical protein